MTSGSSILPFPIRPLANSPLADAVNALLKTRLGVEWGPVALAKPLLTEAQPRVAFQQPEQPAQRALFQRAAGLEGRALAAGEDIVHRQHHGRAGARQEASQGGARQHRVMHAGSIAALR